MRCRFLFLAYAFLALSPSRARACSPAYCSPAVVAPATGATIPANAPALFFDPAHAAGQPVGGPADITLLDGTGMAVPMDATADPQVAGGVLGSPYLLVPGSPLTPSATYRLRFSQYCSGDAQDGGLPLVEQAFATSAPVPLPATAGEVKIAQQRTQAITVSTSRGSCVFHILASSVALEFHPSEELKPWLALARLTTSVDGNPWASSVYGADPAASATYRSAETIFAACPPSDSSDDNGLSLGPHHVELQVHIAGAVTDPPPLSVEVNLSCADLPAPDGGSVMPSRGGCSIGDRFASTSDFSVLLVFAVLAFRRRTPRPLHALRMITFLAALGTTACQPSSAGVELSLSDYHLAIARADCHLQALCGSIGVLAEPDCVTGKVMAAPGGNFSDDDSVAAARATFDPAAAERCLSSYRSLKGCWGGPEYDALRAACRPPFRGLVPEGGACHAAFECADGYCDAEGVGCEGQCKTWPFSGPGSCTCRPSEWCAGIDVGCLPMGDVGAACGANDQCLPGLACVNHFTEAGPAGNCAHPLGAGEACVSTSNIDLPCAGGLYCDSISNKCKSLSGEGGLCNGEVGCLIGLMCMYGEDPPWKCGRPSDSGDPTARIGVPCTPGACGNSFSNVLYCADVCQPTIGVGKPCVPPATGGDNPCAIGACDPVEQVCVAICS